MRKISEEKRMAERQQVKQAEAKQKKQDEATRKERLAKEIKKVKKLEAELLTTENEQHNILKSSGKLLQEA